MNTSKNEILCLHSYKIFHLYDENQWSDYSHSSLFVNIYSSNWTLNKYLNWINDGACLFDSTTYIIYWELLWCLFHENKFPSWMNHRNHFVIGRFSNYSLKTDIPSSGWHIMIFICLLPGKDKLHIVEVKSVFPSTEIKRVIYPKIVFILSQAFVWTLVYTANVSEISLLMSLPLEKMLSQVIKGYQIEWRSKKQGVLYNIN